MPDEIDNLGADAEALPDAPTSETQADADAPAKPKPKRTRRGRGGPDRRKAYKRKSTVKQSTTSPRAIKARAKWLEALEYRKLGYSFHEIAKEMKITPSGAYRMVRCAMDEIISESVEDLRQMQSTRLEAMMTGFMDKAIAGDGEATETCLRIMEQFNRLHGLLAAQKLEHSGEVQGGGNSVFIISEADAKL